MGLFGEREKLIDKLTRYCGSYLSCIKVKSGDCYDSIFPKINEAICKLQEGTNIQVNEDESCPNGGIIIRDRNNQNPLTGEYEILYQACYPCCGDTPPEPVDCEDIPYHTPEGGGTNPYNFWRWSYYPADAEVPVEPPLYATNKVVISIVEMYHNGLIFDPTRPVGAEFNVSRTNPLEGWRKKDGTEYEVGDEICITFETSAALSADMSGVYFTINGVYPLMGVGADIGNVKTTFTIPEKTDYQTENVVFEMWATDEVEPFAFLNFLIAPADCCDYVPPTPPCETCLPEPPSDGNTYGINDGEWVAVESPLPRLFVNACTEPFNPHNTIRTEVTMADIAYPTVLVTGAYTMDIKEQNIGTDWSVFNDTIIYNGLQKRKVRITADIVLDIRNVKNEISDRYFESMCRISIFPNVIIEDSRSERKQFVAEGQADIWESYHCETIVEIGDAVGFDIKTVFNIDPILYDPYHTYVFIKKNQIIIESVD